MLLLIEQNAKILFAYCKTRLLIYFSLLPLVSKDLWDFNRNQPFATDRENLKVVPQPVLRIRDVYPGSWFLPIQPQQNLTNFTKLKNYFIFEMLKKKIWVSFQGIIELLFKNLSLSSKKYGFGFRYPRSRIRNKPFLDPGSQGSKRHRILDPDPQHWKKGRTKNLFLYLLFCSCWIVDQRSGMEVIRIREKYPGSAKLHKSGIIELSNGLMSLSKSI
jgi:hypothetical protein